MKPGRWPVWWNWDLDLSAHLLKRMETRRFAETDLRQMMENADGYRRDVAEGRWIIETRCHRRNWEVIVEPDVEAQLLVVVTAYPVEE